MDSVNGNILKVCTVVLISIMLTLLIGLQASGTKDWNQMRKQVFDNMGSYLARKEERIKSKTQFNVPAGSDRREQNDSDSSKPPEKRIKVTCDDKSNS